MRMITFIVIATLSLLLISCDLSTNRNNNLTTDSVVIDNAEWETEEFMSNSDDFEKDLSDKAKKGNAGALKDLGMRFLHPYKFNSKLKENEELAISLLTKASNKNDAEAQTFLSGVYIGHYGSGKFKDVLEGHKWLERAAENGFPQAENRLGYNYAFGADGYPQDFSEALKWRKRFAVKGSTPAHVETQYNVGWQYWEGKGVEQNKVEAMKWFKMAAENGDADSQRIIEKYGFLLE